MYHLKSNQSPREKTPVRIYPLSLPGTDIIAGEIVISARNGCTISPTSLPGLSENFVITQESVLTALSDKNSGWSLRFREYAVPALKASCRKWLGRTVVPVMIAGSLLFMPVSVPDAHAATITVSSAMTDDPASPIVPTDGNGTGCTLRKAIYNINKQTTIYSDCTPTGSYGSTDTIIIPAGTYQLTKELPLIIGNTTLEGAGISTTMIDGASTYRIFFVGYNDGTTLYQPTVTFKNMTIQNAKAKGGKGNGGGAGLGAGLFMYSGSVTVDTVRFANNQAVGGNGGSGGGGGGMGGNGGSYSGGGFDVSAVGCAWGGTGGSGVIGGGGAGCGGTGGTGGYGSGGSYTSNSGDGGFGGGGGCYNTGTGGNCGCGGGGGYGNSSSNRSNGGFGGGGGAANSGSANGGFGGGGGGNGGFSGYGGGNGELYSSGGYGGGGAGFGGAIFAKKGTMSLKNVAFDTNSATGGTGATGSNNGYGKGGAIFICDSSVGGSECSATIASACEVTFTGSTAADNAGTATDTADFFGNFPAGYADACPAATPDPGTPTPGDPPAAPTGLTAKSLSDTEILLKWTDNSSNETGFIIERADGIHGWVEAGRVGANVTTFTDTGLRYTWQYYYRVIAYNASGSTAYAGPGVSAWTWMFPYDECDGVALNGAADYSEVSLPENSPPGTVIGTFTTINPTGTHRYEFYPPGPVPGIDNDKFEIVGDTLRTGKNFTPDYETRQRYRIGLRSIDVNANYAWCHAEFGIIITDAADTAPPAARSLRASVSIDSETGDGTASPGDTLRFSADIVNEGGTDVTGAVFTVPLPAGTEYAGYTKRSEPEVVYNADADRIEWTGDIPAGQTAEIAFDLKVAETAKTGDVIAPGEWSLTCDTDGDGETDMTVKPEDAETASDTASSGVTVVVPDRRPGCLAGDVNGDGDITLADAVLAVSVLVGNQADGLSLAGDVNGDGQIGMPEAVFVLGELVK